MIDLFVCCFSLKELSSKIMIDNMEIDCGNIQRQYNSKWKFGTVIITISFKFLWTLIKSLLNFAHIMVSVKIQRVLSAKKKLDHNDTMIAKGSKPDWEHVGCS